MRRLTHNILLRFASSLNKNPYELLGVAKEATDEDIKSAYFKLAKLYHPDMNPKYAQKFKQISEAYNILRDSAKRAQFEALSKKVEDRQDISEVQRRYYNTQYHYGYTNKYANTAQDKGRAYQSNPFAGDYQKVFSNEYTREMFRDHNQKQRKGNILAMSQTVKNVLIGILSFVGVLLVAEAMTDVYKFNHYTQKEIEQDPGGPRRRTQFN